MFALTSSISSGVTSRTVFLGVLSRFLEYLLFRLTPDDVLTTTRRVYLGAFQDLCNGITPYGLLSLIFKISILGDRLKGSDDPEFKPNFQRDRG
jgi:hypothetical protein